MRRFLPICALVMSLATTGCGRSEPPLSQQDLIAAQKKSQDQADQDEKAMRKELQLKNKRN